MERVVVDLSPHLGQEIVDPPGGPTRRWAGATSTSTTSGCTTTRPDVPPRRRPATLDVYQHAGLGPEEAARAMTVPPGFQVTLFAGEPDVVQPIAMAIDDRGRLWVAEAYSYPSRVPDDQATRPHPDLRGHRRRRPVRHAQGLRRPAEPRQRPGGRLRRRLGRRGPSAAVHPRQGRRRPARRPAAGPARRLGLARHARDAQHLHLGARRLALRLPRRLHPLARRQARHARRRAHADQRRASGAITRPGTSSRSSPTARATPGASTSTRAAR